MLEVAILEVLKRALMFLLPLILNDGQVATPPSEVEIVAFTADWCPACRRDKPRLEELKKQGYKVTCIDPRASQENRELAKKYGVSTIPAYFVDGKRVDIHRRE